VRLLGEFCVQKSLAAMDFAKNVKHSIGIPSPTHPTVFSVLPRATACDQNDPSRGADMAKALFPNLIPGDRSPTPFIAASRLGLNSLSKQKLPNPTLSSSFFPNQQQSSKIFCLIRGA
jgi:hypothetical protein